MLVAFACFVPCMVCSQVLALLGPKTEEDLKPVEKKKVKVCVLCLYIILCIWAHTVIQSVNATSRWLQDSSVGYWLL